MEDPLRFFSGSICWGEGDVRRSKISIRIVRARNLPAADANGLSDAYVEMSMVDSSGKLSTSETLKTDVIQESLNPTWNYEASFEIDAEKTPSTKYFIFGVYDWDRMGDPTFLGKAKLDFSDILVEHNGRKKHTLSLSHPKKKISSTLIVDTAIENEVLKYLAHLKTQKPKEIGKNCAASLSESLPYGPSKLTSSDLFIWVILEYFAPKCYTNAPDGNEWKQYALTILTSCQPIKELSVVSAGAKGKILVESYIVYLLEGLEHNESSIDLGDQKELKSLYDKALKSKENSNLVQCLYFSIKPALAGYPAAKGLFVSCFQEVFDSEEFIQFNNTELWKNLFDSQNEKESSSKNVQFAEEMENVKKLLENLSEMGDFEQVSHHLNTACLYTSNPDITFISALFHSSDKEVTEQLQQASSLGSKDAAKLLQLLEDYEFNWRNLQKQCYPFEKLLRHVHNVILTTKEWDQFSYKNLFS